MSRVGRAVVVIPQHVTVTHEGNRMTFQGPKGTLSISLPSTLSAAVNDGKLALQRSNDLKSVKALHGLYRALTANIVLGVTEGFRKELEINGVGYRAQAQANSLTLHVGFSHPVQLAVPEGITVETPKPTTVIVKGVDKQLVGQFAATIRQVAPPEPYKGKGIKYVGEVIRRKAGKAATGAKGTTAG